MGIIANLVYITLYVTDNIGLVSHSYGKSDPNHYARVPKGKRFACGMCGKSFERKQYLKTHIQFVHEGIRPFTCEFCKNGFTTKQNMNDHISAVHKGNRPYKCHLCEKGFSSKQYVSEHVA